MSLFQILCRCNWTATAHLPIFVSAFHENNVLIIRKKTDTKLSILITKEKSSTFVAFFSSSVTFFSFWTPSPFSLLNTLFDPSLKVFYHPEGTSKIRILARMSQVSDWGFTMMVCDKIYLEAYTNNKYIWPKKNTAQLYFKLCQMILLFVYASKYIFQTSPSFTVNNLHYNLFHTAVFVQPQGVKLISLNLCTKGKLHMKS